MNNELPKQFMLLNNFPVIFHSIKAFLQYDSEIEFVIVLGKEDSSKWKELCAEFKFTFDHQLVEGGSVRYESVKNGLSIIDGEGIVGIHDAVRPLISTKLISKLYSTAENKGNAVPFVPLNDSIRLLEGNENKAVERSKYVKIQTPQCFDTKQLKSAYEQHYNESITDDASLVEALGIEINLVEGEPENIKITYPEDLTFAEALISSH